MAKTAALPSLWVVDEADIVHTHRCSSIATTTVEYLTAARTATALLTHLDRPDKHERHLGAARLACCTHCIVDMAEIEGANK